MEEQQFDMDKLFQSTMKKRWNEVLSAYQNHPSAHTAKLTKSEETALHIAVSSYHEDQDDALEHVKWVRKLVDTFPKGQAVEILGMPNDKGKTLLHFAAALGSVDICSCIASKDHKLLAKRNHKSETPFFLAAKHGKLEAFLCLCKLWEEGSKREQSYTPSDGEVCENGARSLPDESLFRRNDGCNILHAAISGEHFELAHHIILKYKTLVDSKNVEGSSPLHILATKPSVFQSSSNLRLCDRITYHCIFVSKLKVKDSGTESYKNKYSQRKHKEYPENYETCVNLMQKLWSMFKISAPSTGTQSGCRRKDEESQEEDKYEGRFPPNYATCINLFKFAMTLMLIILGIGVSRIKKIREKKEKHTWAKQIMDKLMEHGKGYKYSHNGQSPVENLEHRYAGATIFAPPDKPFDTDEQGNLYKEEKKTLKKNEESDEDKLGAAIFAPPDMPFEADEQGNPYKVETKTFKKNEESDEDKLVEEDRCVLVTAKMKDSQTKEKLQRVLPHAIQEIVPQQSFVLLKYQKRKTLIIKETPILVAAKMGITEMVDKILETFPVAIQDTDEHEKNALLLATENRQIEVFDLLMKKKLPEFVLYQVDDEGNSSLHLAAIFQRHQPWRIPGAALQMQWEIKWYKHVKHAMPAQCLIQNHKNKKGETAKQIFTRTHEKLVKEGSEWLIKTSESCSLVAALIATVAFATSTQLPGGINDETGDPVRKGQVAFDIFSIASLVALCFSVTALVFFLAILTSRCQEQDFRQDLPRKLLLGLSSLFTSIAGILLSFCAGHFFVLNDELHNAAFFIYGITCLPITFFAFAQLPLYFDLLWSIFRKVPLRCYKVFSH